MHITIGLLVTFAALVLGLLTASVKQAYDSAANDRQRYALQLGLLDQCPAGSRVGHIGSQERRLVNSAGLFLAAGNIDIA